MELSAWHHISLNIPIWLASARRERVRPRQPRKWRGSRLRSSACATCQLWPKSLRDNSHPGIRPRIRELDAEDCWVGHGAEAGVCRPSGCSLGLVSVISLYKISLYNTLCYLFCWCQTRYRRRPRRHQSDLTRVCDGSNKRSDKRSEEAGVRN